MKISALILIAWSASQMLVRAQPPTITLQPTDQVLAGGETIILSVAASGDLPMGFQWYRDGRFLVGATNSTFVLRNAGVTNSGLYYVAAVNSAGMAISHPVSVAVGKTDLAVWGSNACGQLGSGTNNSNPNPVPLTIGYEAITAAAGTYHSLFVTKDKTLWAMGLNSSGQVGRSTVSGTNMPISVASNVVAVAAGTAHSLFVKSDGTLWGMGAGGLGQLGIGANINAGAPLEITTNVVAVAASGLQSLFIKADGTLWGMGNNQSGQLANGAVFSTNRPMLVASNVVSVTTGDQHSLFIRADGTLWALGWNGYGQLGPNAISSFNSAPVYVSSNVVAAAAGYWHSLFIKSDGTLWAMGYNAAGQLGNGTMINASAPTLMASNVMGLAGGKQNSLFIKADGTVWGTGQNNVGQLGVGTTNNTSTPMVAPHMIAANVFPNNEASHSLALGINYNAKVTLSDLSRVYTGGAIAVAAITFPVGLNVNVTYDGSSFPPTNVGSYTAIGAINDPPYAGSATNTLVISPNASVILGGLKQSFTGNAIHATVSTVPPGLPVDLTYNGTFNAPTNWGTYTVVGTINSLNHVGYTTNTLVISPAGPMNQTVGLGATLNLIANAGDTGPTYQWFKDRRALLGATNRSLTILHAGSTNSGTYYVVVTNANSMFISLPALVAVGNPSFVGWGMNSAGQLGNGMTQDVLMPAMVAENVVAGAAGGAHSLFVKSDGTLWAMGYNYNGQLGNGTSVSSFFPVVAGSNVVAVAAGMRHSLFVKSDGTLWAMGENDYGQLGVGTTIDAHLPVLVAGDVVSVAAGTYHSLFLKSDGTLWAMGDNFNGALGDGTTTDRRLPVFVMSNVVAAAGGFGFSLSLKADGTVWAMGANFEGQFGNGKYDMNPNPTPTCVASNVVAVAAGDMHSLFIRNDGTLSAMGDNYYGQLGNGTLLSLNQPATIASNVVAVAAGRSHTLFAKVDGTLWSMGVNTNGQLGYGTTVGTNLPAKVQNVSVAAVFPGCEANYSLALDGNYNAGVLLKDLRQVYTGRAINVTASTVPPGLAVNLTYNGSLDAPTNAGSYIVVGTVSDPVYYGSATDMLVVGLRPQNFSGRRTSNTNGSEMALQLTGTPGYPYALLTATNLTAPVSWQSIFTNVADTNGNWSFFATNLTHGPERFYRATAQ